MCYLDIATYDHMKSNIKFLKILFTVHVDDILQLVRITLLAHTLLHLERIHGFLMNFLSL